MLPSKMAELYSNLVEALSQSLYAALFDNLGVCISMNKRLANTRPAMVDGDDSYKNTR